MIKINYVLDYASLRFNGKSIYQQGYFINKRRELQKAYEFLDSDVRIKPRNTYFHKRIYYIRRCNSVAQNYEHWFKLK